MMEKKEIVQLKDKLYVNMARLVNAGKSTLAEMLKWYVDWKDENLEKAVDISEDMIDEHVRK